MEDKFPFVIDYIKHITTLSTGSIVILATFSEKLKASRFRKSAATSLVGFVLSILSATLVYTYALIFEAPGGSFESTPEHAKIVGGLALIIMWLSFLVGITFLAKFAFSNSLDRG